MRLKGSFVSLISFKSCCEWARPGNEIHGAGSQGYRLCLLSWSAVFGGHCESKLSVIRLKWWGGNVYSTASAQASFSPTENKKHS